MLELVRAGEGTSGRNADYVTETNDHLIAIGVRDRELDWLSRELESGKAGKEARMTSRGLQAE